MTDNDDTGEDREYLECPQCDRVWYLKTQEKDRFLELGLDPPKRCWQCRQKNKKIANEQISKRRDS